ncbi:hypothetical protein SAMN05216266_114208 [Amycolatopsis marina]|uniref:QsdR TetR regulatory C-terminal domain-containing protein n=1 Tax=Amycolatopsis marina TaxID=490629 RepID=A0A1I1BL91_9PSEU|nr:QsdR family transcriptional regulator [Amycolatopsis marina]SFB50592.1 hypothetical protein SAMN05216266_114208 [Amycolatopsis marina]
MAGQIGPRRVVSREHVVRGACRYFLLYGTVDMDPLAEHLAISRATLYRVVHSRDALLADVLWRLGERLLMRARRQRSRGGVDGVIEVTRHFTGSLRRSRAFRAFLSGEPETAARVLFIAPDGVHRRVVRMQKDILIEADDAREWSPDNLDQLAFLYVRIVESALYAELLNCLRIDGDLAERAARAVLRPAG